ncbi:MAG: hypothetical protein Q6L68_15110 [Thermostichus sp. DG02_5_bins_236]
MKGVAGLAILGGVGSLVACRANPAPISPAGAQLQDPAHQPIRRHISKDGTRFAASLGDARALPAQFPAHLHLPQSSVVSSGQIWDREGGMTSLILQTSLPVQEISTYYRRSLWGRGWEILSDIEQPGGIRTLVFESPQRPQQMPQQVVVQVGSPRRGSDQTEQRDILILLSTVPDYDPSSGIQSDDSPVKGWSKTSPSP